MTNVTGHPAMRPFRFALHTVSDYGRHMYPDAIEFVDAECAVDAFDAIQNAKRRFKADYVDSGRCAGFEELATWKGFFERGCFAPDCSAWNFVIAHAGGDIMRLELIGLTEAEFHDLSEAA